MIKTNSIIPINNKFVKKKRLKTNKPIKKIQKWKQQNKKKRP